MDILVLETLTLVSEIIALLECLHGEKFNRLMRSVPDPEEFYYGYPDIILRQRDGHVFGVVNIYNTSQHYTEYRRLALSACGCQSRNMVVYRSILAIAIDRNYNAKVYLSSIDENLCRLSYIDEYNLKVSTSLNTFLHTIVTFARTVFIKL